MNKEYILSNLPPGYVYLAPGEDMPEVSYYYETPFEDNINDILSWKTYNRNWPDEKRSKDINNIFIKKTPGPVVPPAPKYKYKLIESFNIGDVFASEDSFNEPVIIYENNANKYSILGLNNVLSAFANGQNKTKNEMIKFLNEDKYIFITNINDKIEKTLIRARKLVMENKK